MTDFDRKAFVLDVVRAVNEVADEHGAGEVEKRSAMAAIGDEARKGSWYTLPEGDE